MKKIKILQLALLGTIIAALAVSCSPGRAYYYDRYPAPRTSVSLILSPGPGLVISHYPDGRYYYRTPEGYTYWRGYDNRYYLDRGYIGKVHYNQRQYNEWRDNDRRHNGRRHHR